ncbi:uncharacterized protein LOC114539326 [Dendronephthya gigantea]|uniref:uncharacterized protein LOC114539326 n=1 Tax=Dendronephthya gigantea TaxID=151771 RepID=UPI0010696A62|nr:uncharacterized protein LOC114539326 [Dendronephthya gigantea]
MAAADEERRWGLIGGSVAKILTPALRNVLGNELTEWYDSLTMPPWRIDQQTFKNHMKSLPPSKIELHYRNINNNDSHKSPKCYDYAVRDPLSLAKLLVGPFMAKHFTGFDNTMDPSAALSVMSEAEPFIRSGAAVFARKVRCDIRNKWAHCNFSHWTEENFQTALSDMISLVEKLSLNSEEKRIVLDELDKGKSYSTNMDCEILDLIWTELKKIFEDEDSKIDEKTLFSCLQSLKTSLNAQRGTYEFQAPKQNPLFEGRQSELQELQHLLGQIDTSKPKVNIAAICGLGGVGKTSLATEYAHQRKDHYTGGVFWFSGENNTAFENSVHDIAARFETICDRFDITLSATLTKISQIRKPWLIILDNMDEGVISQNIEKVASGHWQNDACGHLLITTRRESSDLDSHIRDFHERFCLSLRCFEMDEAKNFLYRRSDKKVDNEEAEKLIEKLGWLPLALEQAGAYMKSLDCTIPEYSNLYEKHRLRVFNRQAAPGASEYDSTERRAVCTTWQLNFENIIQKEDLGVAAKRVLYASAFLNPKEIQKDIVNIGEPPIEDEEYTKYVEEDAGRREILRVLTKFSLFKENSHSLSVHHLVQEAIREYIKRLQEDESQSVIDAIRMLHHAFRNCASPDELLIPVSEEGRERPSIVSSVNPSRFYQWHKLCSHSYELVEHLKSLVRKPGGNNRKIFQPEAARIVYECAIHLSVNSKHDEAKKMENFAKEISTNFPFPHILPLPELVRRHIQYSCEMPATSQQDECGVQQITAEKLSEMQTGANDLFERGFYDDALKVYSDAIFASRNTPLFEVTYALLIKRASFYLKLQKYHQAAQDVEECILHRPKCSEGYAKRTLALIQLNDIENDFEPNLKGRNSSPKEMRLVVRCSNILEFSAALKKVKELAMGSTVTDQPNNLPVIVLEPGNYEISAKTIDPSLFCDKSKEFSIGRCILTGEGEDCSVTSDDSVNFRFGNDLLACNINFRFAECFVPDTAVVKFWHCSFQGSGLKVEGKLQVESCKFFNSANSGLLVLGDVKVKNSKFYKNGKDGIQVRNGGSLSVQGSKLLANEQGLLIGPEAKKCVVEGSEIYDNKSHGVVVNNIASDITIKRNNIYDNEGLGIIVKESSNVSILENEISGRMKSIVTNAGEFVWMLKMLLLKITTFQKT